METDYKKLFESLHEEVMDMEDRFDEKDFQILQIMKRLDEITDLLKSAGIHKS